MNLDIMSEAWNREGMLVLEHRRSGILLAYRVIPNLITDLGRALSANLLIGTDTAPSHIALGTGTTEAAEADDVMEAEVYREAAVRSRVTMQKTDDGSQYQYTFNIDAAYDISEAGLLNAASGGVLICHRVFTAVPVMNGDTLKGTWRLRN